MIYTCGVQNAPVRLIESGVELNQVMSRFEATRATL